MRFTDESTLSHFSDKDTILADGMSSKGGVAMSIRQTAAIRFGIAGELLSFLRANKRLWVLPMVCVILLLGVLIVLAQSSAIAPFIYTLF